MMNLHHHLELLSRRDRAVGLREAISRAVKPGMRVFDAGCGSGVLTLLSLEAGASDVTAVDFSNVELARSVVAENGQSDRVNFHQADLRKLDLSQTEKFDVVLALLYYNDPRRDERQSKLVEDTLDRFLSDDGQCIPDRVRYLAVGCEWPEQDMDSRLDDVKRQIDTIELSYGLKFQSLYDLLVSSPLPGTFYPPRIKEGRVDRTNVRLLSEEVEAIVVDYPRRVIEYPESMTLDIMQPGNLNVILWRQELWFQDILVFANESISWLDRTVRLEANSQWNCRFDDNWRRINVFSTT